jgi:hypothetical protein
MKRKVMILLLALMALIVMVAPGGLVAAQDVGVVFPFAPGPHEFEAGQPFQIGWMWLAATKGQINVFYEHWESAYTLTNDMGEIVWSLSVEESADYFQPVEDRDPAVFGFVCPMPKLYTTDWWSEEIELQVPGTYMLEMHISVTNPINDGWHTCTDLNGDPVSPLPSLMFPFEVTIPVQIEILPAP